MTTAERLAPPADLARPRALSRTAPYLVVAAAGAVLSLAFPEADAAPLAWVSLIPLLGAARGARPLRGTALGFTFGVGFFGALLIWISLVGWVAWAVLVLVQAAWLGLYGLAWALLSRGPLALRLAGAPAAWVAIELLRASWPVGGFTWGQVAQSQHNLEWMLRPAALAGGWTVAFLVVLVNVCLLEGFSAVRAKAARRSLGPAVIAIAALAAPMLLPSNSAAGRPIDVAIVQGNVPRNFAGTYYEKELQILASHLHLTEEVRSANPDLVVWPESSVGLDPVRNPDASDTLSRAARAVGAPLIVGGNLDVGTDRYKVMAFHVDPSGEIVDSYQKTHLVPFGEYIPARPLFGWIPMLDQVPRDAVAADDPKLFDIAGGNVTPVISFEGDFGSLVRGRIAEGGRLLVVATNTSTWGDSWASAQHVAFSQVRAAENGVWVAHAALSGISALIRPDGNIVEQTPLWEATALVGRVRFVDNITPYARMGDWLPLMCLAFVVAAAGVVVVRGRRS